MPSLLDPRMIPNQQNTIVPSGQNLLDAAALMTSPIPVAGDFMGLLADANSIRQEGPSVGNVGGMLLGALPFVPPVLAIKRAKVTRGSHGFGERGKRTFAGAEVYHSTDKVGAKSIAEKGYNVVGDGYYGEAVSFTDDVGYSRNFGDKTTVGRVKDNAKILDMADDKDFAVWTEAQRRGVPLQSHKRSSRDVTWAEFIQSKGYDGLYDDGAGDLFIFNPKAIEYVGELE